MIKNVVHIIGLPETDSEGRHIVLVQAIFLFEHQSTPKSLGLLLIIGKDNNSVGPLGTPRPSV
jgi:hypothetical protein